MSEQVIGSDDQSLQLSSRLAKKLSKQVPPYQNSYFKPFYKNLGLYYEEKKLIFEKLVPDQANTVLYKNACQLAMHTHTGLNAVGN